MSRPDHTPIVPREKLDFHLNDPDIPRYFIKDDPYRSRFFDALSTMFPVGERFFMECVRDYRSQITDPEVLQDIKDFIRQEGQHTMVHNQYNARLKSQGIDVDMILRKHDAWMFGFQRKRLPKSYTLALTAAAEHLTAISAHALFDNRGVFAEADPRVRAMYAWHAIEEVEHRAVAYDVMQQTAKVGYFVRCLAMVEAMVTFLVMIAVISNYMLKCDGFSFWQRLKLRAKGLWWVVKPGGFIAPVLGKILSYFKPGFHPNQAGAMPGCHVWMETYERTRNPVLAGDVLHASGA